MIYDLNDTLYWFCTFHKCWLQNIYLHPILNKGNHWSKYLTWKQYHKLCKGAQKLCNPVGERNEYFEFFDFGLLWSQMSEKYKSKKGLHPTKFRPPNFLLQLSYNYAIQAKLWLWLCLPWVNHWFRLSTAGWDKSGLVQFHWLTV